MCPLYIIYILYTADQHGNKKVEHIPIVFPETSEVVQPLQSDLGREHHEREGVQKVEQLLDNHQTHAVGDRKLCSSRQGKET